VLSDRIPDAVKSYLYFHEAKVTGHSYHNCDKAVWPFTVYTGQAQYYAVD
jgi:hypothetical protein